MGLTAETSFHYLSRPSSQLQRKTYTKPKFLHKRRIASIVVAMIVAVVVSVFALIGRSML